MKNIMLKACVFFSCYIGSGFILGLLTQNFFNEDSVILTLAIIFVAYHFTEKVMSAVFNKR